MGNYIDVILIILGSFLSLLLMANAYFTRETLTKIASVDLRLAVLIAKHDSTEERSKKNELEIEKIRERIHGLEGSQRQVLSYLKESE